MLYYNRTDLNEGIDVAKSNNSKKFLNCLHWYFNHGFEFQWLPWFDNLYLNIGDIAIITVKGVNYGCIIHGTNRSEAIHLLKNSYY